MSDRSLCEDYEFCVLWGDDGTVDHRWGSYEDAKGRVSELFGDKVVCRTKGVYVPAGDWGVVV